MNAETREILSSSAVSLARDIRERRRSSRQIVDAHIRRIVALHPTLNAVVAERFDAARAEAEAADQLVAAGASLGPLHGVPCTIKSAFALTGMPNDAGLVSRRHLRAAEDAPTVARLRAAGAIPLAVSNTSELCMWMESDNRLYGRTSSAMDPRRTSGGSSGGEGALVGSGGSPFGLGSDVGGSIRMPAMFNGVYGHKVSVGAIPNDGQFPAPAHARAAAMLASGPITRRAEDLWPLLSILADRGALSGHPSQVDISRLRVLDVRGDGRETLHPSLVAAQGRMADLLRARGASVEIRGFPGFSQSLTWWMTAIGDPDHPSAFRTLLGGGSRRSIARQMFSRVWGNGAHTLPAVILALIEDAPIPDRIRQRLLGQLDAFRSELIDALGDDGVLLYPSHRRPAPRHHLSVLRPFGWTYTAIFNALGLPVTQVPLGRDAAGRPVGVQVVAAPGGDARTVAAALAAEHALGGWALPDVPEILARRGPHSPELSL